MNKAIPLLLAGVVFTTTTSAATSWTVPVSAQEMQAGEFVIAIKDNVAIYGSKTAADKVGELIKDEMIAIQSRDTEWAVTVYKGKSAYIYIKDLKVVNPAEETGTYAIYNTVKIPLYSEPNLAVRAGGSEAPGTLWASKKLGNWYYVRTSLGKGWIYNDAHQLEERTVTTVDAKLRLKLGQRVFLHSSPFSYSKTESAVAPQTVTVYRRSGSWYEIRTSLGTKWIYDEKAVLVSAEEAGTYAIHNTVRVPLYSSPNLKARTASTVSPQVLWASKKLGNWYYVRTWLGGRWVYNDKNQLEERVIAQVDNNLRLNIRQRVLLHNAPFAYSRMKQALAPQVVTVYRRSGSWYEIRTSLGTKWIYDEKASLAPVVDLSQAEKLDSARISFTKAVYAHAMPHAAYQTNTMLQPQIMTATRRLGTWYEVQTSTGLHWIDAKQAGTVTQAQPVDLSKAEALRVIVYLNQTVKAYSSPSDFYRTEENINPGPLNASRKLGDWYEIDTDAGKRWVNITHAANRYISAKVEESIGKLPVTQRVVLHDGPFAVLATGQAIAPQTVNTLAKTAGWIQISTTMGPKWIPDVEGVTGNTSVYSYVTASSKETMSDYAVLYGKYVGSKEDGYLVKDGKVIEMKQGFVRTAGPNATVNVYHPQTKTAMTYVVKGTDLDFVKTADDDIYVSYEGKTGIVKRSEAELIPDLAGQPESYFERVGAELYRRLYQPSTKQYSSYSMGLAPGQLTAGKRYYTYDRTKIGGSDSYQYFNYLPLRVKSSYTAKELNDYINLNYPAALRALYPIPPLLGKAQSFIDTANRYSMNAGYLLAHAIHESAWGTSRIAREKNNLFGFRAVDSNPYEGAASFATLEEGLDYCAKYINDTYMNRNDWRYEGAVLGDKARGMNVRYASDGDWGSKIAAHMYRLDAMYGNRERNRHRLGVMAAGVKQYNSSFTVASTVQIETFAAIKGTVTNANGSFYEVVSDVSSAVKVYVRTSDVKLIQTY